MNQNLPKDNIEHEVIPPWMRIAIGLDDLPDYEKGPVIPYYNCQEPCKENAFNNYYGLIMQLHQWKSSLAGAEKEEFINHFKSWLI